MSDRVSDTDPVTRDVMSAMYRRMTAEEKLRRVQDLTETAARLALAGLHARHPEARSDELLLRLARIRLGDEIVDAAYADHEP